MYYFFVNFNFSSGSSTFPVRNILPSKTFDLTDKDIYLNNLESQNKMNINFGTAIKIFESIITNFDEDKTSTVESYPKVPGRFEEVSKKSCKKLLMEPIMLQA